MRIGTVRDVIRWASVEAVPYIYDFSCVDPYINAAKKVGVEVIWDLLHYGWPDGLDSTLTSTHTRLAAGKMPLR